MEVPLQIVFHNMDPSPAIETRIREKADKLETFYERITSCRVVIEAPHKRKGKGNLYGVRIDLEVPGREIVVNHAGPKNPAHEDVYVAIRDAFDALGRRLQDHVRKIQGHVKSHAFPLEPLPAEIEAEPGEKGASEIGDRTAGEDGKGD